MRFDTNSNLIFYLQEFNDCFKFHISKLRDHSSRWLRHPDEFSYTQAVFIIKWHTGINAYANGVSQLPVKPTAYFSFAFRLP